MRVESVVFTDGEFPVKNNDLVAWSRRGASLKGHESTFSIPYVEINI